MLSIDKRVRELNQPEKLSRRLMAIYDQLGMRAELTERLDDANAVDKILV